MLTTLYTNVYDSVPQSNESSDCYGNSKEDTTMPTVDNTALYSQCEQENFSTEPKITRHQVNYKHYAVMHICSFYTALDMFFCLS